MDLNHEKNSIHDEIPKILAGLEETQKSLSSLSLESRNIGSKTELEKLDFFKTDLHNMIDMHFDNLKLSYLSLCATLPCKETALVLHDYIETVKKDLKQEKERIGSDSTEQDIRAYKAKQFVLKNLKMQEVLRELSTPKENVTFEEPEIHINERMYSTLYHTLCEFVTTSLYNASPELQEIEKQDKIYINRPDYFVTIDRVLPTINEEQKCLNLYNIPQNVSISIPVNLNGEIPYSSSLIITPDSLIILCGGVLSSGNLTNKSFQFQTNKDSLGELSNMVVKKVGHSLCYVNEGEKGGSIYAIGGRTNDSVRTKICEKYNILENKWQKIALMNFARSRAAVCPFDDKYIYAFYGTGSNGKNVQTCEKYDVALNNWKVIEIINDVFGFEMSFGAAVQINDKQILLFGGFIENDQVNNFISSSKKVLAFNTNNNTTKYFQDPLPIDFNLSNSSTPIIDEQKIYSVGFLLQSLKPAPSRFLDCDYILKISSDNFELKNLLPSGQKKAIGQSTKEQPPSQTKI